MSKRPFDIDQLPDIVWQRQFEGVKSPTMWLILAGQLKRVADMAYVVSEAASREMLQRFVSEVEEKRASGAESSSRMATPEEERLIFDGGLITVYFMLSGSAIEDLAKGVLIARDPSVALSAGGNLKGTFANHNLIALIEDCGVHLTDEERDVTRGLQNYVVWRGRYPVPSAWKDLKPWQGAGGRWIQPSQSLGQGQRPIIESLYGKLLKLLTAERENWSMRQRSDSNPPSSKEEDHAKA